MLIVHKVDELLFDLFPKARNFGNSIEILKEELIDYYTFAPYKPEVEIKDDFIYINLDIDTVLRDESDYRKAVSLCEKGRFTEAKPILEQLIKNNPSISEYHRILGQIYSDAGDQETAINYLIDALKWDPRNGFAYLMTGNIYAKYKNDITTAMKYYDKALEVNPNDFIAINNIGANLLVVDRIDEAEKYLQLAYSINPDFASTSIGLAQLYLKTNELLKALDYAVQAVKKTKSGDQINNYSIKLLNDLSSSYIDLKKENIFFNKYRQDLTDRSGKSIELELDNSISGSAKIEIAEYYNRDKHLIKHKQPSKGIEHLLMHELVHLEFILEARKNNANKLFISTNKHKENFLRDIEGFIQKLNKNAFEDDTIVHVTEEMFKGLNLQFFNTPIDLFIEDYLFNNFPDLRPIQFYSLFEMYKGYCDIINRPDRGEFSPSKVSEVNTILILVLLYQFTDLYGIDFIPSLKLSNYEKRISKELYNDWLSVRNTHTGGSEYDLLDKWGSILKLQNYFELRDEEIGSGIVDVVSEQASIDENLTDILKKISQDPYNLKDPEVNPKEPTVLNYKDFPAGAMAVAMYCLDALRTFDGKPFEFIRDVGFEIATLGAYGIDPANNEKKFHLATLPDKTFTGLHLLSIMYVAFQHIDPTINVGADFQSEYEMAKTMYGNKK